MDQREFLTSVITTPSGYFELATRQANHYQQYWYEWPQHLDEIILTATECQDDCDVYFSSHLFKSRDSHKDNVLPTKTIQQDLDDADVASLPLISSILTETSPSRHQGFWLLNEALDTYSHEMLSKRLAYSIPLCDHSGWPLGHKVRLPGTINHKYTIPFSVNITQVNTKRYSIEDLELLPELDAPLLVAADATFINHPPETSNVGPYELLESVKDQISTKVYAEYLDGTISNDRSASLFGLEIQLFKAGLSRDQVYWIALHSSNNKFKDLRFNQSRELAKDVLRAERAYKSLSLNIRDMINEIRKNTKMLKAERNSITAELVIDAMKQEGDFVSLVDGRKYYTLRDQGRPMGIGHYNTPLAALLNTRYGLNKTEVEHSYVIESLIGYAEQLPDTAIGATLSHYDYLSGNLLLHTGRKLVYNITADSISTVTNGSHGVVFQWDRIIEPFTPAPYDPDFDWATTLFGSIPNVMNITEDEARTILKVWTLFALLRNAANTRPILALLGQPGSAKGHPDTTLILTPYGYVLLKDIRVGDEVIGSDGTYTTVTGVFPRGELPVFKVTFSDGTSVLTDEEHLWQVQTKFNSVYDGCSEVISTGEIAKRIQRDFRIPLLSTPVQFISSMSPIVEPTIDPYLLGVLLGDGHFQHGTAFESSPDSGVIEEVEKVLPEGVWINKSLSHGKETTIHCRIVAGKRGGKFHENPITNAIIDLDLCDTHSWDKFIPDEFLMGTIDQRLAILQGLLDTDGTISKESTIHFSSASKELAEGVIFIVQSLGGIAKIKEKATSYKKPDGTRVECRTSYFLTISLPPHIIPFRAKAHKFTPHTKYLPIRAIRSVEPAGTANVICLQVSAEDELYVTENFTVTHNTTIARKLYAFFYGRHTDVSGATNQASFDMATANLPFFVLDNLDTWEKWIPDRLAQSAGKTDVIVRKLYSDNQVVRLKRQAMIAVTAHDPKFGRADVADRMIILSLLRFENLGIKFVDEADLINEVLRNRNKIWGAIIHDLQLILATPLVDTDLQLRIQDFAKLGEWIATATGCRELFRNAVSRLRNTQTIFNLDEESILVTALQKWLAKTACHPSPKTQEQLYQELMLMVPKEDLNQFMYVYKSSGHLGKRLSTLQSTLHSLMNIEFTIRKDGQRMWQISCNTEQEASE